MLKHVIALALRYAPLVIALGVLALVVCIVRLPHMAVDVFPELNAPTVVIMTEAGGYAADEVEQYITTRVETAVNGQPGVRRVRSSSATSLSIVWVEFDWGEDIFRARQLVGERLDAVREELPEDVHVELAPISSITGEIGLISFSSKDGQIDDLKLRAFAEFDARTRLLAVPGVSQVVAIGGELPEYRIHVRQDRLRLFGLTLQDVADAAANAHSTASAGLLVDHGGLELAIRQDARVRNKEDIARTLIRYHEGRPLRIGDVADVELAGALKRGTAADHGRSAVVMSIQKAPGVNTLALTREMDLALDDIEGLMPAGMTLNRHVFRQADFIELSVENVVHVLGEAAIIISIVLILFLLNVRTTFITLTALPLSLAVTLLLLDWWGMSLNVMTLGGLAVAIGVLVDDAIIDVENVFRRLRENRARPKEQRRHLLRVVYDASNEIRPSMVFATVIIVLVFVPLLFLGGLEGRFFRPLGIAYIVSILASLIVALTITPALCRYLLGSVGKHDAAHGGHERDGFFVRFIKWMYRPTLRLAIRFRVLLLSLSLTAALGSLWLASTFGSSFLPEFNEGTFTVFLMAPPGTSLDESNRLALGVESRLVTIPGVKSVSRRTGRAERDEHAEPVSSSEIEVTVELGHSREEVRREIDAILADVPGITTMIGQPIEHRLSHILSGTPAAIAINVYGEDLDVLRKLAKEIETALRPLPGARDVNANREVMVTTLPVRYRAADLRAYGLTPGEAAGQVGNAFMGAHVATVNEGIRRYDIVVRLAPDERATPDDLARLLLVGRNGTLVRLRDVAAIGLEQASNLIVHENGRRKAVISCNVAEGHNLGHLVGEVRALVDPIVRRYGCSVSYGGQFEAQQSASATILVASGLVMIVILVLLWLAIGHLRVALLVMINLPLAMIGGVAAIFLSSSHDVVANALAVVGLGEAFYVPPVISIASMVGFVTLFGIAVRNGILLVNHYRWLMEHEKLSLDEAIRRGSEERLVPVLMTALAALLGLLPLAWRIGEPGSELLAPLAIVVLGGLVTSTFLNLVVVPAGYAMLFRSRESMVASLRVAEDDPLRDEPMPMASHRVAVPVPDPRVEVDPVTPN
ncbi:MAG: efflux RND transporter permease subunit [Planctomycetota bacterium]